jgi:ABC-type polysaccharide/polyol phosphate transport system ATPase subunit
LSKQNKKYGITFHQLNDSTIQQFNISTGFKGRIASLLEVGTGFHPELTGRENVFLNGAMFY